MARLRKYYYIPTQLELLNWVAQMSETSKKKRNQALVCVLYLTGARIGEIVRELTPQQIEIVKALESNYLMFYNVKTEKKMTTDPPPRNIPTPIEKNHENEFWRYIKDYITDKPSDTPIFKITTTRSYQIINGWLRKFKRMKLKKEMKKRKGIEPKCKVSFLDGCHYLRHVRTTHLKTLYNYDGLDMMKHHNWSSADPAKVYTHLDVSDLIDKLERA